MSFSVGIGDIVLVTRYAWRVYKACKSAPQSFGNIAHEVHSLEAVLKETEETVAPRRQSEARETSLRTILDGCNSILEDLDGLVTKYQSLGTQTKKTWDRMKWHSEDIAECRARLTSHVTMLTAFICTSQIAVEWKLDQFVKEHQDGRRSGSIMSPQTADSLTSGERRAWRDIRKELEDVGITIDAFNANKDFILHWLVEATTSGALEGDFTNRETELSVEETTIEEQTSDSDAETICRGDNLEIQVEDDGEDPAVVYGFGSDYVDDQQQSTFESMILFEALATTVQSSQVEGASQSTVCGTIQGPEDTVQSMESVSQTPHEALTIHEKSEISRGPLDIMQNVQSTGGKSSSSVNTSMRIEPEYKHAINGPFRMPTDFSVSDRLLRRALRPEVRLRKAVDDEDFSKAIDILHGLLGSMLILPDELSETLDLIEINEYELHYDLINLLLLRGAHPNGDEESFLHYACRKGDVKVVQNLLAYGAYLDGLDSEGYTPLNIAIETNDARLIRILLNYYAPLELRDGHGFTPLMIACESGTVEALRLLLDNGVNLLPRSKKDSTPSGIVAEVLQRTSDPWKAEILQAKLKLLKEREEIALSERHLRLEQLGLAHLKTSTWMQKNGIV